MAKYFPVESKGWKDANCIQKESEFRMQLAPLILPVHYLQSRLYQAFPELFLYQILAHIQCAGEQDNAAFDCILQVLIHADHGQANEDQA